LLLPLAAVAVVATGVVIWSWKTPAERAGASIAEKNAEARGGLAAWRKVKSMSMAGNLDAGTPRDPVKLAEAYLRQGRERKADTRRRVLLGGDPSEKPVQLPFLMELERPRKNRLEIVFQGQTAVQVFDGDHGWKLRPFLGRHEVEPYTDEEMRLAAQQNDLDGPLIDYARKGSKVELVATEPVEGRDAYKVRVTLKTGQVWHVWVDTQTYLDVRIDGTRRVDGKQRPVYTYFRDYRTVDGLLIPHVLETAVEGVKGSEKIRVDRVVVNPPRDEGRFAQPS
jgi:hypothetical protein